MRKRLATALFGAIGALVPLGACGTSAMNTDVCNEIESARCTRLNQWAASGHPCRELDEAGLEPEGGTPLIDFLAPFADGSQGSMDDTAACIQFYTIACLHGTATTANLSTNPYPTQIKSCLTAINNGTCEVVLNPLSEAAGGACSWLIPIDAGPEANEAEPVADVTVPVDVVTDVISDAGADVHDADAQMGFFERAFP